MERAKRDDEERDGTGPVVKMLKNGIVGTGKQGDAS